MRSRKRVAGEPALAPDGAALRFLTTHRSTSGPAGEGCRSALSSWCEGAMSPIVSPICRCVFDTEKLVAEFPPRISSPNKQIVHRMACPPGSAQFGKIEFSRWAKMSLPTILEVNNSHTKFDAREDFFGYEPPAAGSPA